MRFTTFIALVYHCWGELMLAAELGVHVLCVIVFTEPWPCTTVTHLNVTLSIDIFLVFLWPLLLLRRHSSDLHQTYTVHEPTTSTTYIYGTLDPFNNSPGWGGVVAHKVEDHVQTFTQVVCTRIIVDGATMEVPLDRNEHWCSTVQPELSTGCLMAAESVEKNHWRLYDEST